MEISLSDEQEKALDQRGRFVLLACPGSGKTLTVTHRLARRLSEWVHSHAGIATLSFTNVAHEEISRQLEKSGHPGVPTYPHFLGTIDSFINTWIFLPFGHLVMECEDRPSIVGLDGNPWRSTSWKWKWRKSTCYKCDLIDFSYNINGELINVSREIDDCPFDKRYCSSLKERFFRSGYATQNDANYWAMNILETYPQVAKALVKRFPEFIIDEAQDTSSIQMRIVDLLVESGLSEIMLVGDPDQAIFEWRDADPEVFMRKTTAKGWKENLRLEENHRSSQKICDATFSFSRHLQRPSKAVGAQANISINPEIIQYDFDELNSVPQKFKTRCQHFKITPQPETVAILVRTRRILRKILNIQNTIDPWKKEFPITQLLANAAYCYQHKQQARRAMTYMRSAVSRICFGDKNHSNLEVDEAVRASIGDRNWKIGLWGLLTLLPKIDNEISNWVDITENQIKRWYKEKDWPINNQESLNLQNGLKKWTLNRNTAFRSQPLETFFIDPSVMQDDITVETIHAAKGKTYEAVLFVVSDNRSKKGTAKQLGELPDGHEEIRTAYVAMTRPRKLLVVAVPKETDRSYLKRFPKWMKTNIPGQLSLNI